MARYKYGYGEADEAWKMGRIMLKFRPIAPRPVSSSAAAAAVRPVDVVKSRGGSARGKRKGTAAAPRNSKRGRKPNSKNKLPITRAFSVENQNTRSLPVVTLPLMPVTPERKDETPPSTPSPTVSDGHVAVSYFGGPTWRQQQQRNSSSTTIEFGGYVAVAPRPVWSWVTVECVTDAWREGGPSPGSLEMDTCPVFVSDEAGDKVTWTNEAYRRMVVGPRDDGDDQEDEAAVSVALATRGLVPAAAAVTCFTCRVCVRYACKSKGKVSLAAPCDVWRLIGGRLAWRLDVKAALSLGGLGS